MKFYARLTFQVLICFFFGCTTYENPKSPPTTDLFKNGRLYFFNEIDPSGDKTFVNYFYFEASKLWIGEDYLPITDLDKNKINRFFSCIYADTGINFNDAYNNYEIKFRSKKGRNLKWEVETNTICALPEVMHAAIVSRKYPEVIKERSWRSENFFYNFPLYTKEELSRTFLRKRREGN